MNETPPNKIEQELASHIMHTGSLIEAKIVEHLKNYGLTMTQYTILEMLKTSNPGPMAVGEIKDKIPFSNSDITRLIDRLVKKKLVKRTLSVENRRKMDVVLSRSGLHLISNLIPETRNIVLGLYSKNISPTEAKNLVKVLKTIRS
jgi:DNA-binding MarR family transcriptional regulator